MEKQGKAREFTETLRGTANSCGVTLFGTASFHGRENEAPSTLPFSLSDLPYAVSIGFKLSDVVVDGLVDRPTRTYQYHYRQVNLFIDQALLRLLGKVHELGYEGFPVPSSQIVNWESNTGHLTHKVVAKEAGLGWIGRSNLLVSPVYGARVRYGSLFTTMPLQTPSMQGAKAGIQGAQVSAQGTQAGIQGAQDGIQAAQDCGDCFRCLRACPASAIGKTREEFDLGKCTEMLKLFSKEENIGSMICGLCVRACKGHDRPRKTPAAG
ncbi:MAG: hypothetical protein NTX17_08930 [Candidatus Eisenbacteria bacterium]|nr:hypothetical protein [Candidatus Eisenbacteria bacterium]